MADVNITFDTKFDSKNFEKGLKGIKKQLDGLNTGITSMARNTKISTSSMNKNIRSMSSPIKSIAKLIATIGFGKLVKESTQMAMSVESAMDNIRHTMGNNASAFNDWVNSTSKSFGIAKADAYKYGSVYSNLLDVFTKSTKETTDQTTKLMEATAVIASKTGRSFDDTANRIRSGMLGSTEAIEDLGIYTQVSMLESTEAFKKFAGDKSWSKLSFQTQQQIRLAAILEQAYDRYGGTLADTTQTRHAMFIASLNNMKFALGQAFLPIYDVVLPALTKMAESITIVLEKFTAFTASIFGRSDKISNPFNEQKDAIDKSVSGMEELGKETDKTNKKAKKAAKTIQGFDQLNIQKDKDDLGGASSGGLSKPGGGATQEIKDVKVNESAFMKEAKRVFDSFFDVFKKAWSKEGQKTIDSMKKSLKSIWELIKSIGKSFMEVWTNNTGQRMLETMLIIIQNISRAIGNLADSFKRAWEENDVGTRIIQNIADGIQILLDFASELFSKIADWIANVDFNPLLESIDTFITSVNSGLEVLKDGLLWLWDNVLAPLGSWIIETFLPAWIDLSAAAGEFGTAILESIGPALEWFYEEILKPIGEIFGTVIIVVIEKVTKALQKMSDWIKDNSELVSKIAKPILVIVGLFISMKTGIGAVTTIITKFTKAFDKIGGLIKIFKNVGGVIKGVVTGSTSLMSGLSALLGPIGMIVAAIIAVITVGVLLYKNWDKIKETASKVFDFIKDKFQAFVEFFGNMKDKVIEFFSNIWDSIKESVVSMFEWLAEMKTLFIEGLFNMIEGMKEMFLSIVEWFVELKDRIVEKFINILEAIKETFLIIIQWFKETFLTMWESSINSMVDKLKILTDGVKGVIEGVKKIFKGVVDFVSGVFSGDWKKAWEGVKNIFAGVMDTLSSVVKTPINAIISMFNGLIDRVAGGLNSMSGTLSKFQFDIPEWVPVIGDKKFGINIPKLKAPRIPMLAKGGLIPPRKPRQVIVGDNMNEDEIVSPVSTMKRTVKDAISELGGLGGGANSEMIILLMEIRELLKKDTVIELNDREVGRAVSQSISGTRRQTGIKQFG